MDAGVDDLLEGLTEPQRAAVTHGAGPMLVLAGPGSGKTRVITHRAAYLARTLTEPRHILAITFTNKAAAEMVERMRRLAIGPGLTCTTFHSFCARMLRMHGQRAGIPGNFSIFDEIDQTRAVKEAIRRSGYALDNFSPAALLNAISRAKNDMLGPDDYARNAAAWDKRCLAEVYRAYEQVLAEQKALDFDDLLVRTARLLGDDPQLRGQLQDRYRYVLVDEYQDTNRAQYLIARGLALTHENLCVTGDPDQSIYAWRGASVENILQFETDFPKAVVIRLEENFRSTPQVLAAADAVIRRNRRRKHKALFTSNAGGPEVRVVECADAADEARFIAGEIQRHQAAGGRYGDVAVFYRTNALSRHIETALREAGIPYQVARGVAFYQRREIKDVLAYLKVVANPFDAVAFERIINVPPRRIGPASVDRLLAAARQARCSPMELIAHPQGVGGLGRQALEAIGRFAALMARLREVADAGSVRDAVVFVVRETGLLSVYPESTDASAVENMEELINVAADYDRQHPHDDGSLGDWLTQISLVSDVDAIDPAVGAVTLMTLHAAKGLEYDTVFIAGMEEDVFPHHRSRAEAEDDEEERRLCFVGMTRARRALILTCADWRDIQGGHRRMAKSRFLYELPGERIEWTRVGEIEPARYDEPPAGGPRAEYEWREGQMVRHPRYGAGRIAALEGSGRGTRARIQFREAGEKTFVLEFARELEPIEFEETD